MSDRPAGGGWPDAVALVLAAAFPALVIGWREVYVPLAAVAHNLHGQVVVTAGLAVAAARLGGWLSTYGSGRLAAEPAALTSGLALVLLGLVPEEGPLGLLLWVAFGFGWPVLQEALVARTSAPERMLPVWLLLGMALAGPLATGPGSWLVAGGCLLLAWWLGKSRLEDSRIAVTGDVGGVRRFSAPISAVLRLLLALYTMLWLWLVPVQLLAGGLSALLVGLGFAAGWSTRWLSCRLIALRRDWRVAVAAALLLAPITLGLGYAESWWQVLPIFALQGLVAGALQGATGLDLDAVAGARDRLTALGEVAGPLAGAALVLVIGPKAAFAGGAVAALALAGVAAAGHRNTL